MFTCNYKTLSLSFNEFHDLKPKDLPEYGEFCLLELKDGRLTAGSWSPENYKDKKNASGEFIRGTADTVSSDEVSKWHSLDRYDLTDCLEDEEIGCINLGPESEGIHTVSIKDFCSLADALPKSEQYCLLILNSGGLSAGRWDKWPGEQEGTFIYAPALACHSMDEVWAWTALSSDDIFAREEEAEKERQHEAELNRNPTTDPVKFKYGTDISVYYEKALEKLRKDYPWASLPQMKKKTPYAIAPLHGQYVFGQVEKSYDGTDIVQEWTEGATADEFIDYLCKYTEGSVRNSNPDEKFRYGLDIGIYLEKAYERVKKDYRWLNKKLLKNAWRFDIRQVEGDWEFVIDYNKNGEYSVYDCGSAEDLIDYIAYNYQNVAIDANPVVATYAVPFGHVDVHGWNLERYEFSKLKSGDYKVNVQAGDRVTGGSRTFFITPHCFEAATYEEFLDRYLKIVPGSFGMYKEDLLPNKELKEFLGY